MPGPLDFFVSQGWTPVQAAGIVGNFGGESAFNPNAVGDGGSAYGLAQWHPDRQAMFQQVMGIPIQQSSAEQQWSFTNWELNNSESKAGSLLKGATSVESATSIIMKQFERAGDIGSLGKRIDIAKTALSKGKDLLTNAGQSIFGMDTGDALNMVVPGAGTVTDALGITGDCDIICELENWIKDSGFFQRLALAIVAFIVLLAAFYMMKSNMISQVTSKLKGIG